MNIEITLNECTLNGKKGYIAHSNYKDHTYTTNAIGQFIETYKATTGKLDDKRIARKRIIKISQESVLEHHTKNIKDNENE